MQEESRKYTIERQQQGFRSQAHLDAFYATYDHGKTCPECQGIGMTELHDGMQPVAIRCQEWKRLDQIDARIGR